MMCDCNQRYRCAGDDDRAGELSGRGRSALGKWKISHESETSSVEVVPMVTAARPQASTVRRLMSTSGHLAESVCPDGVAVKE
jgi:hypothetical protein